MKLLHKLLPLFLILSLLISISGCAGNSVGSTPDDEVPVETGDEESLALPPE